MFQICKGPQGRHALITISKHAGQNCRGNNHAGGQRHVLTVGIDLPMYEVSTTRGVPSTSTNLKEALCEKIPAHYDLLRRLRQRHGNSVVSHITVENIYQGLIGVNTMVRETSEIDTKYGIKYRGLTIPELISLLPREGKSPSAESVFWLLLTGDIPTQEQTAALIADWTLRRQRRKSWWSGSGGGIVGSILQNLPKTTSPLGKLSVALTVFDSGKYLKQALKNGASSYSHWEYIFEDSMELLANLPAIIGLVAKGKELKQVNEEGDWVQFLMECLSDAFNIPGHYKKFMVDFLRLYVILNADEDGGVPGVHVTEILGASHVDINHALAAGVLAYANEPDSGTMSQYMEFQRKIQNLLGFEPSGDKLKNYGTMLIKRENFIGYKEVEFCDSRYNALVNYVRENLSDASEVKLSLAMAQTLVNVMKTVKGKIVSPEQTTIAAPVFQTFGLKDMQFNQVLLCMSRTLGAIASIIWTRAINTPVERPKSKCTYTYLDCLQGTRKKQKRGKHVKHAHK